MCRNYDKGECAEPGCTGRVSCQNFTDGRCVEHSYNGRGGWSDDEDEDAAEGSTGAPLRQQIAEAIHKVHCGFRTGNGCLGADGQDVLAADAVVALLNLTEERRETFVEDMQTPWGIPIPSPPSVSSRYVTPWLPSTPPDTSNSEPA